MIFVVYNGGTHKNAMQPTNRSTVSALLRRQRFRSFWRGRRCGLRLNLAVNLSPPPHPLLIPERLHRIGQRGFGNHWNASRQMALIEEIQRKTRSDQFEFSKHAVDQSIIRRISVEELRQAIENGEIITRRSR